MLLGCNSKTDMAADDLLKPRFIIGFIALLAVILLMFLETVQPETGVTMFIGILVAFGAYYMRSPRDEGKGLK